MAIVNIRAALGVLVVTLFALAIVWLSTASAYWSGTIASSWPWTTPALIAGVLLGTAAISSYPFRSVVTRIVGTVLFFSGLCVAVFFTGLLTACSFGDCL
ncbi:MAG: hypothetical protein AMXMBFR8_24060 [Nevskiales bacterium]